MASKISGAEYREINRLYDWEWSDKMSETLPRRYRVTHYTGEGTRATLGDFRDHTLAHACAAGHGAVKVGRVDAGPGYPPGS